MEKHVHSEAAALSFATLTMATMAAVIRYSDQVGGMLRMSGFDLLLASALGQRPIPQDVLDADRAEVSRQEKLKRDRQMAADFQQAIRADEKAATPRKRKPVTANTPGGFHQARHAWGGRLTTGPRSGDVVDALGLHDRDIE